MAYPPFGSNSSGSGSGGGVTSLQALTGALMLTSSGATIVITTSGSSINLESTGSGPSGVSSLNGLIGALTLANAAGVSFTASGTTITPALGAITPTSGVFSGSVSAANLNSGALTNGIVKSSSGTLAQAVAGTDYLAPFTSQTANTFYAAPNGSTGVPTFRAIVPADVPTLNQNTTGTSSFATTAGTASAVAFSGITSATNTIAAMVVGNGASLAATGTGTIAATTATALATPRAINGVNFDGTAPITITAAAGTLTGTTLNSTVVTSSLTSIGAQAQALNMNSHLINSVTDPVSAQDAATKNYVDLAVATTDSKQECLAATTTALAAATYNNGSSGVGATLTLTVAAVLILDGYTPALGDRLLIKNQASAFQNGIYTLTTVGTVIINAVLTRATDFDQPNEIDGALVYVLNGTTNGNTLWFCTTTGTVTIGTTNINWSQFLGATYAADGTTLTLTGNTFSVNSTFQATLTTLTGTQTLTNKRITKRTVTAADATSVTPNSDNADITYQLNTQALGTLTINADGGTPTNGQSWLFKIKSTNVQTFSWNALYVGGTVALPTVTTGGGKIDNFAFFFDTVNSKWQFTGQALGF